MTLPRISTGTTKRATLSGVYSATVLFWLGDDSPDNAATWAFLDRRIEDVMRFEKTKAALRDNKLASALIAGPNRLLSGNPPPAGATRLSRAGRDEMTNTMRAIEISEPGGPEVLRLTERPIPEPRHGEIVIKVAFAGVNRPDALQRAGSYKPPASASDLPGLEAAGEIAAIGDGVTGWSLGDQVCALLPGGGYAEYVSAPAAHALPVPKGMGLREAACLPETFFTVWSNVFQRGGLQAGEVFLVHGGSSGIGTTAIQLASVFGARVFATAGSAEKCEVCSNLGAERAINYRDEDYVEVLARCWRGRPDPRYGRRQLSAAQR